MPEVPDSQEIFDANPQHMKLLDSLECRVECNYRWNEFRSRLQLELMIDDKTTQKDIVASWEYIKVMREMLHNFQGPWPLTDRFYIKWLVAHMHSHKGGAMKPKQIAEFLNGLVGVWAQIDEIDKLTGAESDPIGEPGGYPFDSVDIENMLKNWQKHLDQYREYSG